MAAALLNLIPFSMCSFAPLFSGRAKEVTTMEYALN